MNFWVNNQFFPQVKMGESVHTVTNINHNEDMQEPSTEEKHKTQNTTSFTDLSSENQQSSCDSDF
jgi:hypothetical protein